MNSAPDPFVELLPEDAKFDTELGLYEVPIHPDTFHTIQNGLSENFTHRDSNNKPVDGKITYLQYDDFVETTGATNPEGEPLTEGEKFAIWEVLQGGGMISLTGTVKDDEPKEKTTYTIHRLPDRKPGAGKPIGYGSDFNESRMARFTLERRDRYADSARRHARAAGSIGSAILSGADFLAGGKRAKDRAEKATAEREAEERKQWQENVQTRVVFSRFKSDEEARAARAVFEAERKGHGGARRGTERRPDRNMESFFDEAIKQDPQYSKLFAENDLRVLHESITKIAWDKRKDALRTHNERRAAAGEEPLGNLPDEEREMIIHEVTAQLTRLYAEHRGVGDADDEVLGAVNRSRESLVNPRNQRNDGNATGGGSRK